MSVVGRRGVAGPVDGDRDVRVLRVRQYRGGRRLHGRDDLGRTGPSPRHLVGRDEGVRQRQPRRIPHRVHCR